MPGKIKIRCSGTNHSFKSGSFQTCPTENHFMYKPNLATKNLRSSLLLNMPINGIIFKDTLFNEIPIKKINQINHENEMDF